MYGGGRSLKKFSVERERERKRENEREKAARGLQNGVWCTARKEYSYVYTTCILYRIKKEKKKKNVPINNRHSSR